MFTLTADNRTLTDGQRYSYTDDNYLSRVSSILISNSAGFAADQFVLLGEFGSECTEIAKVQSVNSATHALTLTANTKFSHPESTKVTILPYDQVKFYWTATATFDTSSPLSTEDVQADDWFTRYTDTSNSVGFGWFVFYNSETSEATGASNAIPYGNFSRDTVQKVLDSFYSLLNSNDLKLVSHDDAMSWLNEAYAIARSELNLVNSEYATSVEQTLSAVSGTKEYALPSDFSNMISLYSGTDRLNIGYIQLLNVPEWDAVSSNTTRYYLRGGYIGLSPTPSADATYTYRYQAATSELSSLYDSIDLPDNAAYAIKDYMMFRACQKLMRPEAQSFFEVFQVGLNRMKIASHKRDNNLDSWGISRNANV
jgi:hypothetical protein